MEEIEDLRMELRVVRFRLDVGREGVEGLGRVRAMLVAKVGRMEKMGDRLMGEDRH